MRKTALKFAMLVLLLCWAGCGGSQIDSKLDELVAKPAASTVQDAKALYDEVNDLIKWHADKANEPMSAEQLKKAKELLQRRVEETVELGKDKITTGVSNFLSGLGIDLGEIDAKKMKDWFTGIDNPEVDKFKGPDRSPTDQRGAKGWP